MRPHVPHVDGPLVVVELPEHMDASLGVPLPDGEVLLHLGASWAIGALLACRGSYRCPRG
jgi:hypothetical protein